MKGTEKYNKRIRRHKRVRAKISGSGDKPRLCVFKSALHIYAQLIDDTTGKTLAFASDRNTKAPKAKPQAKQEKEAQEAKEAQTTSRRKELIAFEVGKLLAKKALEKKIETAVFDRAGYAFHGRVKALADGAREGGLKF